MLDWHRNDQGVAVAVDREADREYHVSRLSSPRASGEWLLDFRSIGGERSHSWNRKICKSEADAMTKASEHSEHMRQLSKLSRPVLALPSSPAYSPWGPIDHATRYGDGIVRYDTARHGGFKLDRKANATMPAALRLKGGWYEEDCEWARVALAFPNLFTDHEYRAADESLKNWDPDAWEAFTGKELPLEESRTKRQRAFEENTRDKLVVISAIRSADHPDMVETIATIGGERSDVEKRRFLVPTAEYATREPFGFVIDEARHEEMMDRAPSP